VGETARRSDSPTPCFSDSLTLRFSDSPIPRMCKKKLSLTEIASAHGSTGGQPSSGTYRDGGSGASIKGRLSTRKGGASRVGRALMWPLRDARTVWRSDPLLLRLPDTSILCFSDPPGVEKQTIANRDRACARFHRRIPVQRDLPRWRKWSEH